MNKKSEAFDKLNEQINNRISELEKLYIEQIGLDFKSNIHEIKPKFKTKHK